MSETVLVSIIGAAAVVIGALLSFHAGRLMNKSQAFAINTDTLLKLSDKVQKLSQEILDIRNELDDVQDKNRVLWTYLYQVLDVMKKRGVRPPRPPADLENDEKLMELIKWINE